MNEIEEKMYLIFCPCCGSEKVSLKYSRLTCYGKCGRIFNIKELELLGKYIPK